ncbi:MAG: tetratricopeptide repeat protein, partial [Phycisphaerae bacterium]
VGDDDRVDALIEKARAAYEAEKGSTTALNALVDLLMKREREADENAAIRVLAEAFADSQNFSFKARADDLRMKQLTRAGRRLVAKLRANPRDAAVKDAARKHRREQLAFEIGSFRERVERYPTYLRVKFSLAERLFKNRQYDEAIPIFQKAKADGRSRNACKLYIGRCFFEKQLHSEAVSVLKQAVEEHEMGGRDSTGKELHYWWARALEAQGAKTEAVQVFGQLIQWEYNYADARRRLEQLRQEGAA